MFDAKFKLAAASRICAAMVEDFDTAELIISQHDPYELTRAMAVISAQGWTITNGYNMARAVGPFGVDLVRRRERVLIPVPGYRGGLGRGLVLVALRRGMLDDPLPARAYPPADRAALRLRPRPCPRRLARRCRGPPRSPETPPERV